MLKVTHRAGPSCYLLLYDLTVCTNGIVTIKNVFESVYIDQHLDRSRWLDFRTDRYLGAKFKL